MKFNNAFFEELSTSPAVTALCTGIAQEIATDAIRTAPRNTGAYANKIHVEVKRQRRSVALVVASDPKSIIIESKTGNLVRALNRKKRGGRG